MSYNIEPTSYKIRSLCCGLEYCDPGWTMNCPENHHPALIKAIYEQQDFILTKHPGIYKFSNWLPVSKILNGSSAPVTYKSKGLSDILKIDNLYVTFSGYWPEKGAFMKTASFKECEAYSVCARFNPWNDKIIVVASAGNTARAFARVCSENNIPLLICIPEDNLNALWFDKELNNCVRVVATENGSDYYDAIELSNIIGELSHFYPEGGAKNIARRDGMGTTVLSAVSTIGQIPDFYFQAVGSGTGAIAAWEANLRLINSGKYGNKKMRLIVSQNEPFTPIKDAWDLQSREITPMNENDARRKASAIVAKVLANRKPPYPIIGGLFDALSDTCGMVLSSNNTETMDAASLFEKCEGIDIDMAAAVAVSSLIKAVDTGIVGKKDIVLLNITGGGAKKYQSEQAICFKTPDLIIPINSSKDYIRSKISTLSFK
jgi:cysteate synthase